MKSRHLLPALALLLASTAFAAPPAYIYIDNSDSLLIDAPVPKTLFDAAVSPKLFKLYPAKTWGFASRVTGGITQEKTCVVTASALLLPRNSPLASKQLLLKPEKIATTFGAVPNASLDACRDFAKGKLQEAMQALMFALAPN